MSKYFSFILFLLFISQLSFSQDSDSIRLPYLKERKTFGILTGIHQFKNTFIELGVSRVRSRQWGCVFGSYYYAASLSAEYNPFQNRMGIVLSGWTSFAAFIVAGININSYTNFEKYNFGFRPFIGIGPGDISFTYGYNFQLVNHKLEGINKHVFSCRFNFAFKGRRNL